jgi:hypothetical protein
MRRTLLPVCVLALITATASCTTPADEPARATRSPESALAQPLRTVRLPVDDPYVRAMAMFARRGLEIWVETDLVTRWQEGSEPFRKAMVRVAALARLPGVVGVKIADELGYHDGLEDPAEVLRFLRDVAGGLRTSVPGRAILVDMVVPDLGCLPWMADSLPDADDCADHERDSTPAAAMAAVDQYLSSGLVDVLDLSTGLREPEEYDEWGIDRDDAQRAAWSEAKRRGWAEQVRLQSRKALAHPGSYQEDEDTARADVETYVGVPIAEGAGAVDVWTWRQTYQSEVVRLLDPGLRGNHLWDALLESRADGAFMLTHYTPSSVEVSPRVDMRRIAEVFRGVFVAAGTG